jgi:hypothetical protein
MNLKRVPAVLAAALLLAGAAVSPATAATPEPGPALKEGPRKTTAAANPCGMYVGAFDAAGNAGGADVVATKPPTADPFAPIKVFGVKESATWYYSALTAEPWWYGKVISGSALYSAEIRWDGVEPEPVVSSHRIGGGWDRFRQIEESDAWWVSKPHSYFYGLRDDGVLFRWNLEGGFRALGSYPGFASVKTMAIISETGTYDTLLATTRGGALYTIRIPLTSPMKPIVKQVRASTWQGFESIVAYKCGKQGTLLTGIDHDTDSAYLYAVGHANGTSTVIQSLGKLPAPFPGVAHYAMTGEGEDLFGE